MVESWRPSKPLVAVARPSVIQRKITNGYRGKWAADAEAALRTTVDTALLAGFTPFHTIPDAATN